VAVVLEHPDGRQLPITPFFAGYTRVALRVLAELARHAVEPSEPDPSSNRASRSSAITPAERGVREQENEG
jgi:hypothetical protein